MSAVCMIYGATGFTGRLILDVALARGLRPVIAGRTEAAVRALADGHQLPFRAFSLDDPAAIAEALEDVDVVLNAAGPFSGTAEPLAHVCIAEGVHYLDICCEPDVLERVAMLDEVARGAGVTVLSGAGFSPAVAEALALHLKRRLPGARKIVIALSHLLPPTAGLMRAGLGIALRPSRAVRRGNVMPMRRLRVRRFDFGRGPVRCYGLGWGELAAIHRSTGVRNIDFFVQRRRDLGALLRMSPIRAALLRLPPLQRRLDAWVSAHSAAPPPEQRKRARTHLVGYAYDAEGQRAASRLHLPDLYTVTAELAVTALSRAMTGPVKPGVLTPAHYLGADFLANMPGLSIDWEELALSAPGEVSLRIRRHVPWRRRLNPQVFLRARTKGQAVPPPAAGSGEADAPVSFSPAALSRRDQEKAAQSDENIKQDGVPLAAAGKERPGRGAFEDDVGETEDGVRRTGTG